MEIQIFLIWYLTFLLLGIVGLPVTNKLFPDWQDHGYGFAKFIGLFIVAMPVWLLASLHLAAYTQLLTWAWFLFVGIITVALFIRQKITFNKHMLLQEAVFFILLVVWTFIRSANSQIEGTEKMMNLAFMNSINRTTFFPPADPWMAGKTINYYYLGHYLFAFIAKLTAIKMSYVYNFALVTIIAHAFISLNSIFFHLFKGKKVLIAVIIALMGSAWICFGGNMHYAAAWVGLPVKAVACPEGAKDCVEGTNFTTYWTETNGSKQFSYWFPDGTRIISNVIDEFPAYSIVLGDVHGHYLGFPYFIIGLALLLSSLHLAINSRQRLFFNLLISPLIVAFYGINTWDFITINFLFMLLHLYQIAQLRRHFKYKCKWFIVNELALLLPGILLFIPYFLNFTPPVNGVSITSAVQGAVPAANTFFEKISAFYDKLPFGFVPLNVKSAPGPWLLMWGMFLLISAIFFIFTIRKKIRVNHAAKIVIFLMTTALFLIFLVEFVYLKDIFDKSNHPFFRTNTVFKIYYEAWVIWGIGCTAAVYLLVNRAISGRLKNISLVKSAENSIRAKFNLTKISLLAALFIILLFWYGSVSYIFEAVKDFYPTVFTHQGATNVGVEDQESQATTDISNFPFLRLSDLTSFYFGYPDSGGKYNFDGNNYIEKLHPGDYQAIIWLNNNISGQHVIAEAVGDAYTYFARVSANTGLSTIVGWPTHEWQWRGSATEAFARKDEVIKLFTTKDYSELKLILDKYHVEYIFIGEKEREAYSGLNELLFAAHFQKVYDKEDTRIYQVK